MYFFSVRRMPTVGFFLWAKIERWQLSCPLYLIFHTSWQQDMWCVVAVSSLHEQDDCATKESKPSPQWASCAAGCVAPGCSIKLARAGWLRQKRKPCHSGKPSRIGWRSQRSDLWVKVKSALASTFLRGQVTWVKVKSALASTFLRGEVTSEWKSKVHLQVWRAGCLATKWWIKKNI